MEQPIETYNADQGDIIRIKVETPAEEVVETPAEEVVETPAEVVTPEEPIKE